MKTYTKSDYDAFPVIDGIKECPSGDYSQIKNFAEGCSFGDGCSFARGCRFREGCRFGEGCSFGEVCRFREGCSFGEVCSFARGCRFGEGCSFAKGCSFGEVCRFGDGCRFGEGSLTNPGYPFLTFGGGGSASRTIYCFNTVDGIVFRAGCFVGSRDEFVEKVLADDKTDDKSSIKTKQYLGFVEICKITFEADR